MFGLQVDFFGLDDVVYEGEGVQQCCGLVDIVVMFGQCIDIGDIEKVVVVGMGIGVVGFVVFVGIVEQDDFVIV